MKLISAIQSLQDSSEENFREIIREELVRFYQEGESVDDIVAVVNFLNTQKVSIPINSSLPVFDVCGTGGTGKSRINLSSVLAIKLSRKFAIAKHGNKSASGRCGSFDIIEAAELVSCTTPEQAQKELRENNLAFVFGPAFHPVMDLVADIRKSLSHPTIFNLIGPLLNPMTHLAAQLIGVKDIPTLQKLAKVCVTMKKNALLVHDSVFGLDEVSLGGETYFSRIIDGVITEGTFTPEDYEIDRVDDFSLIAGGESIEKNLQVFQNMLSGNATKAQQDFLELNYRVAEEFFHSFIS